MNAVRNFCRQSLLTISWVFILFAYSSSATSEEFPTARWKTASPESQGLDSAVLAEALDYVRAKGMPVHSFLIVRNGVMVLDAYFYPYQGREVHDVASVTKSVTSAAVGVAIANGYFKDVDQKVFSVLQPGSSGSDPRKESMILFRAIRSDRAIPENHKSQQRLEQALLRASSPILEAPNTRVPKLAGRISGVSYSLSPNPLDLRELRLDFRKRNEATATLRFPTTTWVVPIGLDGKRRLVWCPPGRFRMGSLPNEVERRYDETQVDVTLTKGFWMGKYEVTQGQWQRLSGEVHGQLNKGAGEDFPVYWVSYIEAEEFCRKLTAQAHASSELPAGWEFRLPTEAQWEYACRAGTTTATAFGDKLSNKQANFQQKPYNGAEEVPPLKQASRVGSYSPHAWGLYDMHGNVWELCRDWYHTRLPGGVDPDLSSVKGTMNRDGTHSRVRRGGAFVEDGWTCRSACRLRYEPERRSDHIGFRVVAVRP